VHFYHCCTTIAVQVQAIGFYSQTAGAILLQAAFSFFMPMLSRWARTSFFALWKCRIRIVSEPLMALMARLAQVEQPNEAL
jgi:hypothetical protein